MPLVWAGAEMGDGRGRRPEAAHHASPREDEPGRGTKGPPPSWPPPPAVLGILLDCKAQTRPPDLGHSKQSSKVWWQDPFTSVKTTERGGREAQETRDTHSKLNDKIHHTSFISHSVPFVPRVIGATGQNSCKLKTFIYCFLPRASQRQHCLE